MTAERFSIELGDAQTSARVYSRAGPRGAAAAGPTLVLAHGAGAPQAHPWMVGMATAVAARGIDAVTFDFLYMQGKRRGPDRPDVLEATWLAVIAAVRTRLAPPALFIGGKSMGGRIATQVAARDDVDVAGIVLLGYPLHPPGKPGQLRTAHLPRVRAPMLFVQGTRDPFGGPDELAPHLVGLAPGTRIFPVDGGDHSLALPKSRGESAQETMGRVADEIARFTASR
ncbi:MAG: alpha/beta hydrolase family protein [Polyangiaceae bacterium]